MSSQIRPDRKVPYEIRNIVANGRLLTFRAPTLVGIKYNLKMDL